MSNLTEDELIALLARNASVNATLRAELDGKFIATCDECGKKLPLRHALAASWSVTEALSGMCAQCRLSASIAELEAENARLRAEHRPSAVPVLRLPGGHREP